MNGLATLRDSKAGVRGTYISVAKGVTLVADELHELLHTELAVAVVVLREKHVHKPRHFGCNGKRGSASEAHGSTERHAPCQESWASFVPLLRTIPARTIIRRKSRRFRLSPSS